MSTHQVKPQKADEHGQYTYDLVHVAAKSGAVSVKQVKAYSAQTAHHPAAIPWGRVEKVAK